MDLKRLSGPYRLSEIYHLSNSYFLKYHFKNILSPKMILNLFIPKKPLNATSQTFLNIPMTSQLDDPLIFNGEQVII